MASEEKDQCFVKVLLNDSNKTPSDLEHFYIEEWNKIVKSRPDRSAVLCYKLKVLKQ